MYRFTKKQLEEMRDKGYNIIPCPIGEGEAQMVKEEIKKQGFNARCGCIKKDDAMVVFVLTTKPVTSKVNYI